MCETRDLGIKWPQWHTLDVKKLLFAAGQDSLLEEVGQ